ncbi:MAG: hypothetical protein ACJAT5_001054, partial [Lentimonas sp.]
QGFVEFLFGVFARFAKAARYESLQDAEY